MTGIILDSILMLLLVAAIGYGIKLEKKLKALREGQLAFAGAVTELNNAAGRAEKALATLRASGQETDLLHDRIIKARAVKQELEVLIARAPAGSSSSRRAMAGKAVSSPASRYQSKLFSSTKEPRGPPTPSQSPGLACSAQAVAGPASCSAKSTCSVPATGSWWCGV